MRHQPGERAGAEVFERKRRPVKQLDDAQALVEREDRHRKIERVTDQRFQRHAIEFVSRELCRQCNRDVLKRSSALAVPPVVIQSREVFRNVEPAVRRKASDDRLLERDRGRLPPSADANHETTRAPCRPTEQTHKSDPASLAASNARCIAAPAACAISTDRVRAKMEGPEPDKLEPSAPAAIAADFTAAKPGTSEARFASAIESTSERDNNSRSFEYKAATRPPTLAH